MNVKTPVEKKLTWADVDDVSAEDIQWIEEMGITPEKWVELGNTPANAEIRVLSHKDPGYTEYWKKVAEGKKMRENSK